MTVDYLIVGQGLAGTVIGETLLGRGCSVGFVDQGFKHASSTVAVGMYNPVGFKRINKSWMADELIPYVKLFYSRLQTKLAVPFIQDYQIIRFFPNSDYRKQWDARCDQVSYISASEDDFGHPLVKDAFGFGRVRNCGRIVLGRMLIAYREYLRKENLILEEELDFDLLDLENSKYKSIQFGKVIFCLGHEQVGERFFSELPLRRTKGELLRIKATDLKCENLLNRGFFLVPDGNDEYLVGSTYNWKDHSFEPTEEARISILERLEKLYKGDYEVLEQTAGLRPTVKDRRPLIGIHPERENLGIFNGLGTKGVLLAPYWAYKFADHLEKGTSLSREVDIRRFN